MDSEPIPADTTVLIKSIVETFEKFISGVPVPIHLGSETTFLDVGPPGLLLLDVSLA